MFPRLRLLVEYAPLLAFAQEIVETDDPHERALLILKAAEWLALRSDNSVDDHVVTLLKGVLASPEGEALFHYIIESVKGLLKKDD